MHLQGGFCCRLFLAILSLIGIKPLSSKTPLIVLWLMSTLVASYSPIWSTSSTSFATPGWSLQSWTLFWVLIDEEHLVWTSSFFIAWYKLRDFKSLWSTGSSKCLRAMCVKRLDRTSFTMSTSFSKAACAFYIAICFLFLWQQTNLRGNRSKQNPLMLSHVWLYEVRATSSDL